MWHIRYMCDMQRRTDFLGKGQKDNPVILTPANHGFQWELGCFASVRLHPPTPLVPWYCGKCSSQESLGCAFEGEGGSTAAQTHHPTICVKVRNHEAHLTYGLSIIKPFFSIFMFLFCCKRNQNLGKEQNPKNLSQVFPSHIIVILSTKYQLHQKERGFCCSD